MFMPMRDLLTIYSNGDLLRRDILEDPVLMDICELFIHYSQYFDDDVFTQISHANDIGRIIETNFKNLVIHFTRNPQINVYRVDIYVEEVLVGEYTTANLPQYCCELEEGPWIKQIHEFYNCLYDAVAKNKNAREMEAKREVKEMEAQRLADLKRLAEELDWS